jgi:hypothetical protein
MDDFGKVVPIEDQLQAQLEALEPNSARYGKSSPQHWAAFLGLEAC